MPSLLFFQDSIKSSGVIRQEKAIKSIQTGKKDIKL